jgi:hypothetical protein
MVWVVSLSTAELIPHSLTPRVSSLGIRGLVEFGKLFAPLHIQSPTSKVHP